MYTEKIRSRHQIVGSHDETANRNIRTQTFANSSKLPEHTQGTALSVVQEGRILTMGICACTDEQEDHLQQRLEIEQGRLLKLVFIHNSHEHHQTYHSCIRFKKTTVLHPERQTKHSSCQKEWLNGILLCDGFWWETKLRLTF